MTDIEGATDDERLGAALEAADKGWSVFLVPEEDIGHPVDYLDTATTDKAKLAAALDANPDAIPHIRVDRTPDGRRVIWFKASDDDEADAAEYFARSVATFPTLKIAMPPALQMAPLHWPSTFEYRTRNGIIYRGYADGQGPPADHTWLAGPRMIADGIGTCPLGCLPAPGVGLSPYDDRPYAEASGTLAPLPELHAALVYGPTLGEANQRRELADSIKAHNAVVDRSKGATHGLHFELFQSVEPDLSKVSLVAGIFDPGAMSVMYGESNTGKTFVALDFGFHIATGREWQGRRVEKGGAVYVAAEGGGAIRKRVAALRKFYGAGTDVPLALVPCPVDLSGKGADVQPLVELIEAAATEMSVPIRFLVIDTLSRALAGANENAPEDMTAFVRNVDRIRSETGAHVLVVHHSGKDKARGARGHSSLRAATDTELEVADRKITVTKQRDMEIGPAIGFDLVPVTIGTDAHGMPAVSCVVGPRAIPPAQEFGSVPQGSPAGRALAILRDLIAREGQPAPEHLALQENVRVVRLEAWREACKGELSSGTEGAARKSFLRATKSLAGHIGRANNFVWLQPLAAKGDT